MNRRRFLIQLSLLTTAILGVLFFLQMLPDFQSSKYFSLMSVAFFVAWCVGAYFLGAQAAISKDKNAFTRLIMLLTFGKLFMVIIMVVAYHRIVQPENNYFILPFFLIYIVYTIFETIFLTKLGKIKAR